MPARRTYASRGVPSRGSRAARARRTSTASVCALVAVVAFVLGGGAWLHAQVSVSAAPAAPTSDAQAAPLTPTALVLDMAPVATPPSQPVQSVVTRRQWDTVAPGITIDPALAARLDEALSGVDGQVGVAVKDLASGRGAVLGGHLELQAASLYKLPVLYTVFDSGLSMDEELAITEEARSYDAGTMELGVGESLSVAEALERMVTLSDNTSAVMLGSRVGAARVTASIHALGMDTTHYSLERMTTSALDMVQFLDTLAHGRAASPAASADMLHLLLRQRVNDRLPRLLPDAVQVAHKTGNLPGVVNDVGILYGPNATVAVVALVSDTSDETAAATGIARLGLAAYSYFDVQQPLAERPTIPPSPARSVPPVWREPRPPTATLTEAPVPPATLEPTAAATSALATVAQNARAAIAPISTPTIAPTPHPTAAATAVPTTPPTAAARPIATAAPPTATAVPTAGAAAPTRPPTPRPPSTATPAHR